MKRNRRVPIYAFLLIWFVVNALLLALPITPVEGELFEIVVANFVFAILVVIGAIFGMKCAPPSTRLTTRKITKPYFRRLFFGTMVVSATGLALITIERIFIRKINYSQGFRAARYQWLASQGGNILSILGNLMVPFSYCVLFLTIFHWENLKRSTVFLGMVCGMLVPTGLAILNGGRSNILVVLIFSGVVCFFRFMNGKRLIPKIGVKLFLIVCVSIVIVTKYVIALIYAFSDNTVEYLIETASAFNGSLSEAYVETATPFWNTVIYIFLYLFHGNYVTGNVISGLPWETTFEMNNSLRIVGMILDKLNVVEYNMTLPPFDNGTGAFISLPGIFLFDYNVVGFVVISILLGFLFGLVVRDISKRMGPIKLIFSITIVMLLFSSPITGVVSLGYFYFVFFSYGTIGVVSRLVGRSYSWISLEIDGDIVC